ncbi:hypothetical protein SCORR_v1c03450 [Spiroplasma corruscae]|uniref:Uncharacterized protein n=1 Tax=Spiroplasma corruscae TaxID=216934 RepID=A0A222ENP7_9MOLU|nr:hypothetical protein [Spiroplasma corruscae]ASP28119.1 hypothetical protein SCORR_v1c03450 [Spiroplasma corruscae]
MEIEEKSNLLIVYLKKDEDIFLQLTEITRIYRLIKARITGFGYLNRLEYGILSTVEPLFLTKNLIEDFITVSSINGMIYNKDTNLMINSVDKQKQIHLGRFISGLVADSFTIFLNIIETE